MVMRLPLRLSTQGGAWVECHCVEAAWMWGREWAGLLTPRSLGGYALTTWGG